jgi:hypothetical protein
MFTATTSMKINLMINKYNSHNSHQNITFAKNFHRRKSKKNKSFMYHKRTHKLDPITLHHLKTICLVDRTLIIVFVISLINLPAIISVNLAHS